MYKKPVIVFEGIEGSGKSFHLDLVSKYLKKELNLSKLENQVEIKTLKKLEN